VHRSLHIGALCLLSVLLTGCLTVGSKEYHVTLRGDGSGEARIVFRDIHSEDDDTTNTSKQDFRQLIDTYLTGNRLEKDNPGFHNVRKRLFEENGKLCGEVSLSFDSLSVLRLFRYGTDGPLMFFVGSPSSSEVLQETNGTFGRDWMPVVFWPSDSRELFIRTRIVSQASFHHTLLPYYRQWEQAGKGLE
jgi:hypothetical protein